MSRLPHARGGVSYLSDAWSDEVTSSPRPWGCFLFSVQVSRQCVVFPTPVGVFLLGLQRERMAESLPHARGGVSSFSGSACNAMASSPRPWGCFRLAGRVLCTAAVFPTPVGVFPTMPSKTPRWKRLPHARGGVSKKHANQDNLPQSSPRPWGCF